jgi:hypothetical protein
LSTAADQSLSKLSLLPGRKINFRQRLTGSIVSGINFQNALERFYSFRFILQHRVNLPEIAWGIRAEFWIEGVGDAYGQDTNEAGTYLRLASDQVRFYRTGAAPNTAHAGGGGYRARAFGPGAEEVNEPLCMDQVPRLVFSEIMRDVDLFVGVGSIGNDPTWQDGGRETRYGEYWRNYSFGELSATGISRRDTLQRLIPRLKIADKCVLSDRFLLVQGTRRRYKIHLGSGNILMEPNDLYLCIVPDARALQRGCFS